MFEYLKEEYFKIAAILLGGVWVLYIFLIKRERFPKVEFNLDLNIIERTSSIIIIEFVALIENKGTVRHKIDLSSFILKIRYITKDDFVNLSNYTKIPFKDNLGAMSTIDYFSLNFPHTIKPELDQPDEIYWIPKEWDYIFIDGGSKQKISLPLTIPIEARIILLKSEFKYKDKQSDFHSAQNVFNLDKLQ